MKRITFFLSTQLPASQTDSWHTFGNYIFDWAKSEGAAASFVSFSELVFELKENGDTRLRSPFSDTDIAETDFAVFRTIRDHNEQAEEVALFLTRHRIPYIDERVRPIAHGKYSWQVKYAENQLSFIPTICGTGNALRKAHEKSMVTLSFPCVVKARHGRKGMDNYLVKSEDELLKLYESRGTETWVVQPFLDNDGDYRLVVLGGVVTSAMFRQRAKNAGTHLNNTSQGATATLVDISSLPKELCEDAVAAARVHGLAVAGVDMMIHKATGRHVILEVNGAPQLSTGAFPEEKMKGYTDYLSKLMHRVQSTEKGAL